MKYDFEKVNPVFESFTDYICEEVYSKKKKAEIKEEMTLHLAELYEQYTALGMSEEDASQKAVLQMGKRKELREEFSKLYWIPPYQQIRTTINCLIFGILFIHLHLGLFAGSEKLGTALGTALVMFSAFRLSKNGGIFKPALKLFLVETAFTCVIVFLDYYYCFDWIIYLTLVSVLLTDIFYFMIFLGLKRMCRNEGGTTHILGWGVTWMLTMGFALMLGQEPSYVTFAVFLGFFVTVILLFRLRRVKKILGDEDSSVVTRQSLNKKETLKYAASALSFVLIIPILSSVAAYTREPDFEPYDKTDTQFSKEAEKARENMLSLGLPEEYLNDLPDSEVIKYKNARHMEASDCISENNDGTESRAYYFYCKGEFETVRVLYCLSGFDNQKFHSRDGFYFWFYDDFFIYSDSEEDKVFSLMLSEKNGETYRSEPLLKKEATSRSDYNGYEFSFVRGSENRRAYFADSQIISNPDRAFFYCIDGAYFHKKLPLAVESKNTLELAEIEFGGNIFAIGNDLSYFRNEEYRNIEYKPEWLGIEEEK